jgi:hypothetical protein
LQFTPDEARTTAILPSGELIDRLQDIAGNVADRQYLNSRRLRPWINRSGEPTTSCPQIKLSPPFPAISAASFVIVLIIFIHFVHNPSSLSQGTAGRSFEKSLKNLGDRDLDRLDKSFVDKKSSFLRMTVTGSNPTLLLPR